MDRAEGEAMKHTNEKLSRQLSSGHVWAMAFGCIIGWGSFVNPGKKFLPNSGVAGTAIAMVFGALVMIIIACSYAYMVPKLPKAGGEYTFTKACYNKTAAFICGWFLLAAYLTNVPMNSTALGLIVDGIDGTLDLLKFGFHYSIAGFEVYLGEILFSISILILFAFLNIWGVKKAGNVQIMLSGMLVCAVVILVTAAAVSSHAQIDNMDPLWGFDKAAFVEAGADMQQIAVYAKSGPAGILSAILATFAIAPWAFVGFDTIPQAAEEFDFSHKKVIGIMIIAILFGCFVYTANTMVAAAVLEDWPQRAVQGEWILLIAAEQMLGTFGKMLVGIAVLCAVLSGIMGFYMASSRLIYSMAQDGCLPAALGEIDEKYKTPKNAILFCMAISLCGPVLGREALGWFVDMSAIGTSIGFFFTCTSTLKLMKKDRDGSVFLKLMANGGCVFSILFVILQVVPIPFLSGVHFGRASYIMLIVWIIMGWIAMRAGSVNKR